MFRIGRTAVTSFTSTTSSWSGNSAHRCSWWKREGHPVLAVPPLLAKQIARKVFQIIGR